MTAAVLTPVAAKSAALPNSVDVDKPKAPPTAAATGPLGAFVIKQKSGKQRGRKIENTSQR